MGNCECAGCWAKFLCDAMGLVDISARQLRTREVGVRERDVHISEVDLCQVMARSRQWPWRMIGRTL